MTPSDHHRLRYESFVRAHAADLQRFAYRLTGSLDSAQDLVQETFLEAWRSIAQQSVGGRERSWLFSILRHRWAHLVRDASRRIRVDASDSLQLHNTQAAPTEDTVAQEELLQLAMSGLDPRFKEAFLMVFLQGLTCKEAAAELGVPIGTILSRISRARAELRTRLGRKNIHLSHPAPEAHEA